MFTSTKSIVNLGNPVYRRRILLNRIMLTLSMAALLFGLFWLFWIIGTLILKGAGALSLTLFTQSTPPPGVAGGLLNAILGSVMMAVVATLVGTPIGILAGTYLAEYGRRGWLAPATRFLNDVLLSAPSIVIGLFIYAVYVAQVGHYSGWAARPGKSCGGWCYRSPRTASSAASCWAWGARWVKPWPSPS